MSTRDEAIAAARARQSLGLAVEPISRDALLVDLRRRAMPAPVVALIVSGKVREGQSLAQFANGARK